MINFLRSAERHLLGSTVRAEVRVHLKLVKQLGQGWVLDSVSGPDLEQKEIPETTKPVITQDILSSQASVGTRKVHTVGIGCHLPLRRRSPETRATVHIEKHDGVEGSRPACLSRTGRRLLVKLPPKRAACSGLQKTPFGIPIEEEVLCVTCALKPYASRLHYGQRRCLRRCEEIRSE